MGLEGLVETVITFTCISSVVSFALENIRGVIKTDDHWDEVMLSVSILICYTFDGQLLQSIAGNVSALSAGPYVDYLIGGSAMAGGGAKLLKRINRDVSKVKKAAG